MRNIKLYVGAMNDGLFIIDRPPSPSGTDEPPSTYRDVNVIAKMTSNDRAAGDIANKFAAAPELYEALKWCVDILRSRSPEVLAIHPEGSLAASALAKAEGRS